MVVIVDRRLTMTPKNQSNAKCKLAVLPQSGYDLRPVEGPDVDGELAALAKALSHPVRVCILRMLSHREARYCSAIVSELSLAQSTVSEHLRILKEVGLVRSSEDGNRTGYCIESRALRRMKALIAML
jgi:ArsR family transcriptional regulator